MVKDSRKIAAILAADVIDYSRLMATDEAGALAALKVRRALFDRIVAEFHGLPFGSVGDSLMARFSSAVNAVLCALEIQKNVEKENQAIDAARRMRLRVGVHLGDVIEEHGAAYGDTVNVAARLQALARPDGVLISSQVYDQVYFKVPARFASAGTRQVKNIPQPVKTYHVMPRPESGATAALANVLAPLRLSRVKRNLLVLGVLVAAAALGLLWRELPTTTANRSIAVLPFANLSEDKDNDYFSDGLSEELLNLLAQIPELRVAARTSSFSFRDKNKTIPQIGQALGVDHVLEGSVRKSGNDLRIVVQLVDTKDGHHLWSRSYDRTMDDIFKVQSEIAAAVVSELKVNLLGSPPPEARPTDPGAYALFLRARYFFQRGTEEDLERALSYYRQVIDRAEDYAPAWAGLAAVHTRQVADGYRPPQEGYEDARAAAVRAIDLNPKLAAAHAAIGEIYRVYDWDWTSADESLRRARELAPNDARILTSSVGMASTLGRFDEGVALARAAIARDPLEVRAYINLGLALWYAGRLEEAEDALRQVVDLNPERPIARVTLGLIAIQRGQPEAGLAHIEAEPSPVWRMVGLPIAYHALGRRAESDAALAGLTEELGDQAAYQIAQARAFRGEIDEAFAWLDRAYAQRDSGLSEIKGDPLLRNLEDDPRFDAFLTKMNLPVD